MTKNVLGFVLIDAPHSALNNAGQDVGARTENAVVVKVIRKGRSVYPYVSGQAWRYWWRMVLEEKFGWPLSPIIREAKVAFTAANPFEYPDDDVFGYMRALKKTEGGTLTRLSPLKCSPLVSVYEHTPTDDFGVMARHKGDPVPFEHQFYSTTLKGIFSLDISNLGVFTEVAKTGFKNLDEKYTETPQIKGAIEKSKAEKKNGQWILPKHERLKRCKETIAALPYIYSTTKGANHLTDVTPKFIILTVIEGGNHLFMSITNEDAGKPIINVSALKQVIIDYNDSILSDIYIGRQDGFLDSIKDELEALRTEIASVRRVNVRSPKQAVEEFVGTLEKYIA
ncbi:type I-B CRISPR-associated protein Cas7/Cst2/DevR [candidate division KSB1 bacterium]|nr:MAG: type I-B CRISPR-associated protein Cas7/Cst2/DevR [candidate division KSB1 bacterium]